MFDLVGYSQRGMVNALFYDMGAKPSDDERLARLSDFLGQCHFPRRDPPFPFQGMRLRSAKVRIEQSFSDFGELDALVLLEEEAEPHRKHALYIEAKVKTAQRASLPIRVEWSEFLTFLAQEGSDSNLFLQLYRKIRLVHRLTHPDDEEAVRCSVPGGWDLGTNPVVQRAWMELTPYCQSAWYLALVPSGQDETEDFFRNVLFPYDPAAHGVFLPQWTTDTWGYLCWKDLENYCSAPERREEWWRLLRNFEYNRGQIYGEPRTTPEPMELTRERVEAFLRRLTGRQRFLLRAIARSGGAMRQGNIMWDLTFLGGVTRNLGTLKSVINKACDRVGLPRLLVTGPGKGDACSHEITSVDLQLRSWVIGIASAWDLEADPTAAL